MKMSGLYEVSWPEYTGNRTACLSDLLNRKVFVDVTLVFDDNEQVSAHKVILSSSSSFFQNFLENNPHPNPLIYMKGLNKKLFASLLDFIYLGEVSLPESDFETFIFYCDADVNLSKAKVGVDFYLVSGIRNGEKIGK